MAEIPEEAMRAAIEAIKARCAQNDGAARWHAWVALEAAAPLLAADLLRPLLKRHPRVEGEWGPSCGTCWIKGGSRAAWPCAEVLAISVQLPIPDDEGP